MMLRTNRRQAVDAVKTRLDVAQVPVAEQHGAGAGVVGGRRRADGSRLVRSGQVAVGGVRVVDVVERTAAMPDVDVDAVAGVRLDVDAEPVDAVDRLLQLVRSLVFLRVLQALRAERTQQQRQEQIQNLRTVSTARHCMSSREHVKHACYQPVLAQCSQNSYINLWIRCQAG